MGGSTPTGSRCGAGGTASTHEKPDRFALPSLCPWLASRRIEGTWDLWPLAAETAKEPTSRSGKFPNEGSQPHVLLHNRVSDKPRFRAIGPAAFLLSADSREGEAPAEPWNRAGWLSGRFALRNYRADIWIAESIP